MRNRLPRELKPKDFFHILYKYPNGEDIEIVEAHIKELDSPIRKGYDLLEVKMRLIETNQTCTHEWRLNYGNSAEEYYISIGDEIHPLLAFESRIEDNALVYAKDEIVEAVTGLKVKSSVRINTYKGRTYYRLEPMGRIY